MMQNWNRFEELLNGKPFKSVIVSHTNPDADAIGSSLAWAGYLQKKGHTATVVVPNECAKNLRWMNGYDKVITFEQNSASRTQAKTVLNEAEVIFCLDFNALQRIKELGKLVEKATALKIMIDHHLEPEDFAQITFSDTTKAATAEYLFELIQKMGDNSLIDNDIAACLYAGIMTDTGSFRHGSTTAAVHEAVASLMRSGLNVNRVHRLTFDENPISKTRLLGYVLHEKLVVLPEYNTAYMTLSDEELRRFESNMGDTEGIVNYGLQIEGIVMAVLMIERKDEIKLSFRSVEDFSVRALANEHFDGGGHKNASGGRTTTSLEATVEKLLNVLPLYQNQLNNVKVNN